MAHRAPHHLLSPAAPPFLPVSPHSPQPRWPAAASRTPGVRSSPRMLALALPSVWGASPWGITGQRLTLFKSQPPPSPSWCDRPQHRGPGSREPQSSRPVLFASAISMPACRPSPPQGRGLQEGRAAIPLVPSSVFQAQNTSLQALCMLAERMND